MDRAANQSVQLVSGYYSQGVQRTLANRAVLQSFETATKGEKLCRYLTERSAVPYLKALRNKFVQIILITIPFFSS
jgi:hypothetical protein